ncbi:MAG: hypothetical protein AAGN82_20815 [Myxococcota bacterium]
MVVGLLFMPVLAPIGLARGWLTQRRKRRDALSFRCIECGHRLGHEAISQSNEQWDAEVRARQRANPDVKFRLERPHDAICGRCRVAYRYLESGRCFERLRSPA